MKLTLHRIIKKTHLRTAIWCMLLLFFVQKQGYGQIHNPVVQFSGVITAGDSLYGLGGVHIINKNSRKGSASAEHGFFSIPTLEGDSILFSYVGFKSLYVQIPEDCEDNKLTLIVEMELDTTNLEALEVLPYPSLQLFKDAFVKTELPEDPLYSNMNKNLNQKMLRRMMREMDMTASMNYKHYSLEQIKQYEQPNFLPSTQLVNPLAWLKFIKALKNGDFKRDD